MSGAWIETPWVFRLALTLLHFVWQGGAVYAGWLVCRALMRNNSAEARYLLALVAMATMTVAPVITFFWLETPAMVHRPMVSSEHLLSAVSVDFWTVVYQYHQLIVLGWLTGVGLLALRLLLGYGTTLRLRRSLDPIGDELAARFLRLADKLRLGRCPRIGFSAKVSQAMTIGFIRPVILLPLAWLTEMTPQVLEAVVAHELAHTKRGDLWVNLLQRLAETLLFFHPAVWWISREIRLEREYCCDELAVAALGSPLEYAKSLEAIATWQLGHGSNLLATPFLGERKMNLLDRVRRVLGTDSPVEARKAWPLGLAILATPLLLWAFSLGMLPGQRTDAVAEDPQPMRGPGMQYGFPGGSMDGGSSMGDMSQIRMGQSRQPQTEGMGSSPAQRAPESPQSDLSPRDRAMLQMLTELRFEVISLRNEIQQMRQPGGGNQPQYHPPGAQHGGYGTMQSPYPHQQFNPAPPSPYANQYQIAPPKSSRSVPTTTDPQEGDKTHRQGNWEKSEPSQAEPKVSKAPSRDNPWIEVAEGMMQLITPESPQARDLTPRQQDANEVKAESMRIKAEQAHRAAEMERLHAEEQRRLAEDLRMRSERQAEELQQRLRDAQAMADRSKAIADEARHRAELAQDRANEELHRVQAQLNKAALRIKELEDKEAAAKAEAAQPEPQPTETPTTEVD